MKKKPVEYTPLEKYHTDSKGQYSRETNRDAAELQQKKEAGAALSDIAAKHEVNVFVSDDPNIPPQI